MDQIINSRVATNYKIIAPFPIFLLTSVLITLLRIIFIYYSKLELYGDEAQYWIWSLKPDFGYYSKPPMVAWLIALTTTIYDHSEFSIRLSSPILHFLTSIVVYILAKELLLNDFWNGKNKLDIQENNRASNLLFFMTKGASVDKSYTSLWIALLYLTLPAVCVSSALITTDPSLLFFWCLSLFFFIISLEKQSLFLWMMTGSAAGFGMLSKYNMLIFYGSAILYVLLSKSRNKSTYMGFLAATIVAALIYFPNLIWNLRYGLVSYLHTVDNAYGSYSHNISIIGLLHLLSAQFATLGPLIFIYFIYSICVGYGKLKERNTLLLYCFSLLPFAVIIAVALFSRAHANWPAPAYIATIILVGLTAERNNQLWVIKYSIVLHVIISIFLFAWQPITNNFAITLPAKIDPFKRIKGYRELSLQLNDYCQLYDNAVVAIEGRMDYASFVYYAKDCKLNMVKWNPSKKITDHFSMTTDLNLYKGRDILLITKSDYPESYTKFAPKLQMLKKLSVAICKDYFLEHKLFLLKNFQGY